MAAEHGHANPSSGDLVDGFDIATWVTKYEPGENWWWCYPDDLFFGVDGAAPSPSHP